MPHVPAWLMPRVVNYPCRGMYTGTLGVQNKVVVRITLACLVFCVIVAGAAGQERWIDTVLPDLYYSSACWSSIDLHNLGDRPVTLQVEGHRESGALVALAGHRGMAVQLEPGDQASFKLQIADEATRAWVKVREKIPGPPLSAVVAVSGKTDCVAGNELRTAARAAAFPTRNPWFSDDVSALRGEVILLINTTEHTIVASACYSAGSFYSVPEKMRTPQLLPLCSTTANVQIAPFGSREFPVERGGNTHFSLNTRGDAIVLQMLRLSDPGVRLYTVDSTITFGSEAASPDHQKE